MLPNLHLLTVPELRDELRRARNVFLRALRLLRTHRTAGVLRNCVVEGAEEWFAAAMEVARRNGRGDAQPEEIFDAVFADYELVTDDDPAPASYPGRVMIAA